MSALFHLYKVSPPRSNMVFQPSRFWHTADWESSTDRPREGYIEDTVLYAGDFEEVSIHLFPRVRTLRVSSVDVDAVPLGSLGLRCSPEKTAHIFAAQQRKEEVEAFCPTIFRFEPSGFTRVRRGEYVSRRARTAIGSETIPISEAIARWNVEICYVEDLEDVIARLRGAGIYFEEQR